MKIIYKNPRVKGLSMQGKVITSGHIIKQSREDIEELEQYQELKKILK